MNVSYNTLCRFFVFQAEPTSRKTVTLVPGDGVGPEIMASVREVFKSARVPVDFEEIFIRCLS